MTAEQEGSHIVLDPGYSFTFRRTSLVAGGSCHALGLGPYRITDEDDPDVTCVKVYHPQDSPIHPCPPIASLSLS